MKDTDLEEKVEQQPSAKVAQQKAVEGMQHLSESHGPAADLPSRPILGVHEDLSGAALVRRAMEGGQGAGDDWAEFKYRHRQAEQDSQLLYATLQQAEQFHQVSKDSRLQPGLNSRPWNSVQPFNASQLVDPNSASSLRCFPGLDLAILQCHISLHSSHTFSANTLDTVTEVWLILKNDMTLKYCRTLPSSPTARAIGIQGTSLT